MTPGETAGTGSMARLLALGDCRDAVEHLLGNGYEVLRAAGQKGALGLIRAASLVPAP